MHLYWYLKDHSVYAHPLNLYPVVKDAKISKDAVSKMELNSIYRRCTTIARLRVL